MSINPGIMAGEVIWHQIKRAFGVLCVFLVIGGVIWAAYVSFIKPHTNPTKTTSQTAKKIINNTNAPSSGWFGCSSLKVYQYYENKKLKVNKK